MTFGIRCGKRGLEFAGTSLNTFFAQRRNLLRPGHYGLLREWVEAHPNYRVFLPEIIHPFPLAAFEAWRAGLEHCTVVELSYQGQFYRYLASLTDMRGVRSIARSGGAALKMKELETLLAEEART